MLLVTLFLMAVFLALLGTSSFVHDMIDHKPHPTWVDHFLNWIPIMSLAGFYISFSLGFQPVIRVLVGEIFPTDIRSLASGIVLVMSSTLSSIAGLLYPITLQWIGFHGTFWGYAAVALITNVYCYFTMLESKGKSLVKLEQYFD